MFTVKEKGWTGPHPLFPPKEAFNLAQRCSRAAQNFASPREYLAKGVDFSFDQRPWFKSVHAYLPEVFNLVSHPGLLRHITPQLGPDVMVWGTSIMRRAPGETHRWHTDIEHLHWPGVSIFLGLQNTFQAGLKFIEGSHRFPTIAQHQKLADDAWVLTEAQKYDPDAMIAEPLMSDGEFLLFDGRTWHGSRNNARLIRTALIIQYTVPSADVRIPLNFNLPTRWHSSRPPCIVVTGTAQTERHLITQPLPFPDQAIG